LSARMIAAGLPPDTPACAVFDATRPTERTVASTIAGLPTALQAAAHKGPCLVMIGVVFAPVLLDTDVAVADTTEAPQLEPAI
jgi:uroporphyrin-III C-methyltransferase